MSTTAIKIITTSDLDQRLHDDVGVHVWNVLNDEYFSGELIPGSRRAPLAHLDDAVRRSTLSKDASIVVYCAGASCPLSRQAAEKLLALGYARVETFEGGLEAWKQAGHGVVGTGATR